MNWNYTVYSMITKAKGYDVNKFLKECMVSQYFTKQELEELQMKKLSKLISYAYDNVPYYREIMDEKGIRPKDIQNKNDLSNFPILTKDIIREKYKNLISIDKRKYLISKTGGSTGEPFSFHLDFDSIAIGEAAQIRCMEWAGYCYADKTIVLGGSSLGLSNKKDKFRTRFLRKIANTTPMAAVHMDNAIMAKYCEQITTHKPRFIRGYPSAIFLLSNYILENNLPVWKPKAIFTTAERLHQKYRDVIEKAFGCKIFDGYGCRDGGGHAFECNHHSGLHLSDEVAIAEVMPDSPCEPDKGEILFTDLHNYVMPFIRYSPGDKVKISSKSCPCGRNLTLLEDVIGRSSDILLFKNSKSLSMPAITLIFREFSFLQYQLHQLSEVELLINLVYSKNTSNEEVRRMVSVIQKHLGSGINIECKKVDCIPLTSAGKTKICISNMPENKVW